MYFGLTNAPAVFQNLINDVLRKYLDQFIVAYLDDILIFSSTEEEHVCHVKLILEKLRKHKLYAKLKNYSFHQIFVEFLGYIIDEKG